MGEKPDNTSQTGLQFFGKISASISHELKNVMAIVNENAGLLEDLTLMAEQGKPLDPARLKRMAAAVQKQVGRADVILNNMNRFAHSIDATVAEVDLNKTIELFMALTDRFIVMRGVTVDLQLPARSIKIRTAPYFLINLLWLCLDFAMSACGDDKQLVIVAEEAGNSLTIRFQGLSGIAEEQLGAFPADREKSLLSVLEADLAVDPDREEVVMRLAENTGVI